MLPHPHEILLRDLYTALLERDLGTLQLLVAPGVVCHLPKGEARGFERVFAHWSELTQRSASQLELSLCEVLVGGRHAAALGAVSMQGEHAFVGRFVCLVRLDRGRVLEGWLHLGGA